VQDVLRDLEAEQGALDAIVSSLDDETWDVVTPAEPWTIRDQVGHLAFFDEKATLSASDPQGFIEALNRELGLGMDAFMALHIDKARSMPARVVLDWWRSARAQLATAFEACDPEVKLPWYGPPMKAASSAVARLMETWAHGQDVADALGIRRMPTDRLFRIAELGVKTFRFGFENRGLETPTERVRVTLVGPSGRNETWNPGSTDSVEGSVEEFCLVVAQRRHVLDTNLVVSGPVATRWMEVAQVFAGPPGPGRSPSWRPTPHTPRPTPHPAPSGTQ
jgi:uncharacterized protein (TIGR03084 family)